mgnify:CR=1 FL=1
MQKNWQTCFINYNITAIVLFTWVYAYTPRRWPACLQGLSVRPIRPYPLKRSMYAILTLSLEYTSWPGFIF